MRHLHPRDQGGEELPAVKEHPDHQHGAEEGWAAHQEGTGRGLGEELLLAGQHSEQDDWK